MWGPYQSHIHGDSDILTALAACDFIFEVKQLGTAVINLHCCMYVAFSGWKPPKVTTACTKLVVPGELMTYIGVYFDHFLTHGYVGKQRKYLTSEAGLVMHAAAYICRFINLSASNHITINRPISLLLTFDNFTVYLNLAYIIYK